VHDDRVRRDLELLLREGQNVPDEHKGTFGYGDVWTWVAICADTKLILTWLVGQRTIEDGLAFMYDLKARMSERIQLSTDGHQAYRGSVPYAFEEDEVDWAQIHKIYKSQQVAPGRYSPPACTGTKITVRLGDPDPSRISTSYVERQNLTMRIGMRRFTRLTNGFSEKIENHIASVAIHFMHYNFARPHKTLANPYPRTPAMAASVEDHVWSLAEIVEMLD